MSILDFFPMIQDVKDCYRNSREKGYGREAAIEVVLKEYAIELQDEDDRPQVWIGLAEVTGRRKELTEALLSKAELAFTALETAFPEATVTLRAKKKTVCDPAKLGPEAKYRKKIIYRPDWKIGDTFLYKIQGDYLKGAGLTGWYIIARKVQEIVLAEDCCLQGMYYSLCPPGKIPSSKEDLERLGYVPLRKVGEASYLFMGKVWVNSKSAEKKTYFQKIGNFPLVSPPDHETFISAGKRFREDQYTMEIEGKYFWYLEAHVGYGYQHYGIIPCKSNQTDGSQDDG